MLDVKGQLRDQFAVGVAINHLLGHTNQRVKDLSAQSMNHTPGDNIHKVITKEVPHRANQRQHNGRCGYSNAGIINGIHIALRPQAVNHLRHQTDTHAGRFTQGIKQKLGQIRQQHVSNRVANKTHNTEHKGHAINRDIAQQPLVEHEIAWLFVFLAHCRLTR